MGGRIIGVRQTVLETSFYDYKNEQWMHVARYYRHTLHSTKGWRKSGTHKMVSKIHAKYRVQGTRTTERYERTYNKAVHA